MRKFYRKKYLFVALCVLMLTACANSKGEKQQDTKKEEQTKTQTDANSSSEEKEDLTVFGAVIDSENPISQRAESVLDLSEYGLDYEFATDAQPEYLWTSIARAEGGYYLWEEDDWLRLMYYDIASGSYVPLCNKPNCSHNDEDCNAVFSSIYDSAIRYQSSYIQYYDGCVYVMGYDTKGYVSLYQVAPDGSTCEQYMTLYKADLSSTDGEVDFRAPYVCIHRGYVYFINNFESTLKIRRIKLGEDDVEIVFENADERPDLYRMEAYGDYLFFQSGNFIDDDYIDIEAGVFAMNVNTVEVQMVKKGAISDYAISDGCLYYSTESGINCYSLTDGMDQTVISGINREILVVHGKYIYCYDNDSNTLSQYNLKGELLGQVVDSDLYTCCLGDADYLFAYSPLNAKVIATKDLSQENAEWKALGD